MLGLPQNTEMNKQLPKKAIYTKFQMNSAAKEKIDHDISKLSIVNEISPSRVQVSEGESVKSFYVLLVSLKHKDFDEKNIITISKIIPQNMLMVLEYEQEARLAVYHTKLMMTPWQKTEDITVTLKGLDLNQIWENIIVQNGEINMDAGNTLEEQIALDEQKAKLQKEIAKLEKQARAEKQPKKKFELVQKINKLKGVVNSSYEK